MHVYGWSHHTCIQFQIQIQMQIHIQSQIQGMYW